MKKIDFHAHYLTPSYRAFLAKHYGTDNGAPHWDADSQLKLNHDNEIVYSLLGISTPYFYAGNIDETKAVVELNNDEIAQAVRGHEDELGFLAALPLPDNDLCLREMDRTMLIGARGFTFCTNTGGVYLGHPSLEPVMKRMNEMKSIAIVHPTKPVAVPSGVLDDFRVQALEFFFDTTRTFINMSRNLVFSRYPDIRWVFPHAGALIPIISDRVLSTFRMEGRGADLLADLKHVYFDVAGPAEPKLIDVLKMVAPIEHIVYGSDGPYAKPQEVEKYALILENTDKLTKQEKEQIFYLNGVAFLGL